MTHVRDPADAVLDALRRLDVDALSAPLSTLAFWSAIALPVLYLPLLAAGIDSVSGLVLFLGLFGLHVLALLAGHAHAGPAEA